MSELTKRILVGIVAAPLVVALVYVGGLPLAALLALLSAVGAWELYRIARAGGSSDPLDPVGIPLSGAIPLAVFAAHQGAFRVTPSLAAVLVAALIGAAIWTRGTAGKPLASVAVTVLGVLYTGGMLSFAYLLRYHPYTITARAGTAVVGYPVILTWVTDIGAYAVGRTIGGRKLIPSVSPGKTISGAVGGVVVAALVSWAYVPLVLQPWAQLTLTPGERILFGVAVSVAAQVGDLAESLLKREGGVKDSSRILPGHGGVLDRLDSLFFVLPLAALLLTPLLRR